MCVCVCVCRCVCRCVCVCLCVYEHTCACIYVLSACLRKCVSGTHAQTIVRTRTCERAAGRVREGGGGGGRGYYTAVVDSGQ